MLILWFENKLFISLHKLTV